MQFKSDHMSDLIERYLRKILHMHILCTYCACVYMHILCVSVCAQNLCELGRIIRECFPSPTVFSLSQISNYCFSCKQLPMLKL